MFTTLLGQHLLKSKFLIVRRFFISQGYVCKNKVELEQSINILKKAKINIDKHPSKANDSGSLSRTAQHLLTRTLNKMNLMMELSDCVLAAALIGLPTELCSETFVFTSPKNHLALIQLEKHKPDLDKTCARVAANLDDSADAQERLNMTQQERDIEDDFIDNDEEDSIAVDEDRHFDEVAPESDEIDMSMFSGLGNAPFYSVDNNNRKQAVPPPLHYRYRGTALWTLNRHEYYSLIKIQRKKAASKQSPSKKRGGRKASKRFCFSQSHPLHASHEQHLVSKHPVLVCCGVPPKHPGNPPTTDRGGGVDNWEKSAQEYARYYLCMYRPELPGLTYQYEWDDLVDYVTELTSSPSALSRFRLRAMERHSKGVSSTFRFKRCLQLYRAKSRTLWNKSRQAAIRRSHMFSDAHDLDDNEVQDEEEYEEQHKHIARHRIEMMEKSIKYSNGLLASVKDCLRLTWQKMSRQSVVSDEAIFMDWDRQDLKSIEMKLSVLTVSLLEIMV